MKNISDKTVVRVRVPKNLYEAIQKKLALKEVDEAKTPSYVKSTDSEEDKPKYAGINMSKTNVMNKVGKGKQSKKITGAKAAAYQPVHSGVYKEEEASNDVKVGIMISFKGHDEGDAENLAETYRLSVGRTMNDPYVYGELSINDIPEFIESLNVVHGISNTTLTNYRV